MSYPQTWKRVFDFLAALLGIVIISPLLIVVALLIKVGSNGPVFYLQQRIGRNFRPFQIYKFRTMRPGSDANGNTCTVKGDDRITEIGGFLRKTKLDELPQLFNVLKGDMSLVGPRPEVAFYVNLFKDDYSVVLNVRPGITDYSAIEYSNEEEILSQLTNGEAKQCYPTVHDAYIKEILPVKIVLYKKYISEQSFLSDLKLIARTFLKILKLKY